MGGDGGTALTSRKDIRAAGAASSTGQGSSQEAAAAAAASAASRRDRLGVCALSGRSLGEGPIVVSRAGLLFSKESLVEALIRDRAEVARLFPDLRRLGDVIDCRFTPRPKKSSAGQSSSSSGRGGNYKEDEDAPWVDPSTGESRFMCPLTQVPLNGIHAFSVLWPSGTVISNQALATLPKEIVNPSDEHPVRLFPTSEEDLAASKAWIEETNAAEEEKKKRGKKRQRKESEKDEESAEASGAQDSNKNLRQAGSEQEDEVGDESKLKKRASLPASSAPVTASSSSLASGAISATVSAVVAAANSKVRPKSSAVYNSIFSGKGDSEKPRND